jgi:hypothetical protein
MDSIDAFIPRESDILFALADEYEEMQKVLELFTELEYIDVE